MYLWECFLPCPHQEYRKLHSLTELNAKFRYIQLCRSLKTYGVTFFLVKEKMKGRNKLIPRLLGVTRESVMRVDETSKEASSFTCQRLGRITSLVPQPRQVAAILLKWAASGQCQGPRLTLVLCQ